MEKDSLSHKPKRETKREKRLILERIKNIRDALINHCVNWRSFFNVSDLNEVQDADLIRLTGRIGGFGVRIRPWVANSKDKTLDFKIVRNPHGMLVSHLAVDSSIVDVVEILITNKFHLSWANAPHLDKPIYRLTFMDMGYIRQVSNITPVDFMNKIIEQLTGIREVFYFNCGQCSVIIQKEGINNRLGDYKRGRQWILTMRPKMMLQGVEKVILDISRPVDLVGIPVIHFVFQSTTNPDKLISDTEKVNQFLLNIINSF